MVLVKKWVHTLMDDQQSFEEHLNQDNSIEKHHNQDSSLLASQYSFYSPQIIHELTK